MKTQNHTLRTLISAEQAICDADIPVRLRIEMSLVIGTAYDGGSSGAAAWTECETIAGRGMTAAQYEAYDDLVARIDLDAIRTEGRIDAARDRLIEIGLEAQANDILDMECLSREEHLDWIVTADAEEIRDWAADMRAEETEETEPRYEVVPIGDDGLRTDLVLHRTDCRDEAKEIACTEASGRSHGCAIIDRVAGTVDYGDRVERIGGGA